MRALPVLAIALLVGAACSGDDDTTIASTAAADGGTEGDPGADGDAFPDVVDVEATYDDQTAAWTFAVTISSPYDTPERYADGWRVVGPAGQVFGVHTLLHDHANEQPFTRRQTGVEIPDDVATVTIEGRDQANGFGGDTVDVDLEALR